ncbi:unnamed protein product [Heterobilharzia americana]|nr:unnamed protein product [Heterobilharzia americana]
MLLTNFDCSLLWLCDHHIISDAFEANPLYLRHTFEGMPEYRDIRLYQSQPKSNKSPERERKEWRKHSDLV